MSLARLLWLALIAALVVLPVRHFVGEPIYVASPSMEPTLSVGQHALLDKIALRFREPARGEIVVFRSPVEEHDSIKRVVALPGETVELRDKKVYLNGKPLEEPYAVHRRASEKLKGDDLGPFVVPERHLFVLGDNRDESLDSSVWTDPSTGAPQPFLPIRAVRGLFRGAR